MYFKHYKFRNKGLVFAFVNSAQVWKCCKYRNPAGNHGLNGPGGGLGHVPNAPVAVPDDVLGVLDGDAAEQDM